MKPKVTMQTIADKLNVSVVTVSRALNDKDGVSEVLRQRIKQLTKELNYRPNSIARSLKMNRSYNVGVLISNRYADSEDEYYINVYKEMVKKATELKYSLILEILSSENEENLKPPYMYSESKIDGLIVLGQLTTEYLKEIEKNFDLPVLYLDFYLNDSLIDSIIIDNFYASYQLTLSLLKKGHREIGFVGNIYSTSSIQDRYLGYYKALLEWNLKPNDEYLISDRDGLGRLIDLKLPQKMPTAFVANCDKIAHKLNQTLNEHGYIVPDDVSVVGFDNSVYSTLTPVKITTVDNNIKEMVHTAVNIIVKKIKNPERKYGRILVEGKIIERESSKTIS